LVCLDLLKSHAMFEYEQSRGADLRLNNARRVLSHARLRGWSVTHVFDHTARGRRARAIEGLEPLQVEPVLYRTGVSAFSNRIFCEIAEATMEAELILMGLSLSRVCLATALAARDRGLAVALVEDVLSGSPDSTASLDAIHTLSQSIAAPFVRVLKTDDLIDVRRGLRVVN
jgi:nicotinamidase-related amidase